MSCKWLVIFYLESLTLPKSSLFLWIFFYFEFTFSCRFLSIIVRIFFIRLVWSLTFPYLFVSLNFIFYFKCEFRVILLVCTCFKRHWAVSIIPSNSRTANLTLSCKCIHYSFSSVLTRIIHSWFVFTFLFKILNLIVNIVSIASRLLFPFNCELKLFIFKFIKDR